MENKNVSKIADDYKKNMKRLRVSVEKLGRYIKEEEYNKILDLYKDHSEAINEVSMFFATLNHQKDE